MHKIYGFNPIRCNSASTLSGCIEKNLYKVIIVLLTNSEVEQLFEKSLRVRFSCINMRLDFDSEILLPNLSRADYNKMNIDQEFSDL